MTKKKKVMASFTHTSSSNLIAYFWLCRAPSTSSTRPVHVFAAYVKLRSSLLLGVRPIGRLTHPAMPTAKRKALRAGSNPLCLSSLKPRNRKCHSSQPPVPHYQPRCWPMLCFHTIHIQPAAPAVQQVILTSKRRASLFPPSPPSNTKHTSSHGDTQST
jgi:hypothetical protein